MLFGKTTDAARLVGAGIGAAFGIVLIVAGLLLAGSPTAREQTVWIGVATLLIGALLGWSFGPSAAGRSARSVVATAGLITVLALPLGAFCVALGFLPHASEGLGLFEAIAGALGITLVGLLFLGIPLGGLVFVAACVWIGLVRLALRAVASSRSTS